MKILIAPLDWGLGHATRCVPVIEAFLESKAEVIIGSCANLKSFFAEAFPQLEQVELPSYGIEYPTHGYQMPAWLLSQLPRLQKIVKNLQKADTFFDRTARQTDWYLFSDKTSLCLCKYFF